MSLTARRPVHLNLFKIKLPIGGIMSIIHRATGVFMFLVLPYLIYLLDLSLSGESGYAQASASVHGLLGTLIVFLLMWSVAHHLLAGIRYLLIDVDIGVEKGIARQSAWVVTVAAPLLAILLTGGLL